MREAAIDPEVMGIRYYAYAFDAHQTDAAVAHPRAFVSTDPFADARGMEAHVRVGVATMKQRSPERDMLYLDKAWSKIQRIARPRSTDTHDRPALRPFDGDVAYTDMGWDPFVQAVTPEDVALAAPDVSDLLGEIESGGCTGIDEEDREYVLHYLRRASEFVADLAADGRGMVYLIG